ncbi:MAG: Uma2 family endonuclease [Aridibacter sp.]
MSAVLEQNRRQEIPPQNTEDYSSVFYDGVYYPEEREDDMGETSIHINLLADLLKILKLYFDDREDVFLSGNMNLYYEEGNSRRWFAPDLLIAFGVSNIDRASYLLWREGVFPQVVFEIASKRTWQNDVDEKLRLYEELGAEEYYVLDPKFEFLSAPLLAYRRQGENLIELKVANERILSPRLGLEIVREGNTFRLFNPNTNEFLMTLQESERKRQLDSQMAERKRREDEVEIERLKAEIERLKAQK